MQDKIPYAEKRYREFLKELENLKQWKEIRKEKHYDGNTQENETAQRPQSLFQNCGENAHYER